MRVEITEIVEVLEVLQKLEGSSWMTNCLLVTIFKWRYANLGGFWSRDQDVSQYLNGMLMVLSAWKEDRSDSQKYSVT